MATIDSGNWFCITYIILGIIVTILTFKFSPPPLTCPYVFIAIMFWPYGVIWFLLWYANNILYDGLRYPWNYDD